MAEAQRALRRLCISVRSHSKSRPTRYKRKVENFRIAKSSLGVAFPERLVADKVLSLEGTMYFLEPDLLGSKVGVSFQDLKLEHYRPRCRPSSQVTDVPRTMADTCCPSRCSTTGFHGTRLKPMPSSSIAKRPLTSWRERR